MRTLPEFILQIIFPLLLLPILFWLLKRLRYKRLALYQSPLLGKIEVFEKYNKERTLTINSYPQGVSTEDKSIKGSYWYKIAKEAARFCQNKSHPKILMLGLGANTIPNLIARFDPAIQQTIVEFDSSIIEACREFFGLDKLPHYELIQADAFKIFNSKFYILNSTFEVVIIDIFTGEPPYVDFRSNEAYFIKLLLPHLKRKGSLIFNRPAHLQSLRAGGEELRNYLSTLFKQTQLFDIQDPRGFRNYVIVASEEQSRRSTKSQLARKTKPYLT